VWPSRCCCTAGPGLHEGVARVVDVGEDESAGEGPPLVVAVAVVDVGEDERAGEGAPHAVAVAVDTSLLFGSGACRQQAVAVVW